MTMMVMMMRPTRSSTALIVLFVVLLLGTITTNTVTQAGRAPDKAPKLPEGVRSVMVLASMDSKGLVSPVLHAAHRFRLTFILSYRVVLFSFIGFVPVLPKGHWDSYGNYWW